jgi:hypothetical protein
MMDVVQRLSVVLDVAPLTSALAELVEGLAQFVRQGAQLPECLGILDAEFDAFVTSRTCDGVLRFEPSQRLLECVAAMRALQPHGLRPGIEGHDLISAGSVAGASMEGGGPEAQRLPPAAATKAGA